MNVASAGKVPSQSDGNPSRQQRRLGRTRRRLCDAARSVFAEKGLDLTTVDDITERADVGKGTFYYHFSDKQDIIGALLKDVLSELTARINERCHEAKSLHELLDAMIRVHIEFFASRWEDFVLYYQGRADLTLQKGYEGIETPFIDYLKCIESHVDSVISAPIPDVVLRRLAMAVAGFLSGYYSFAVVASEGEDVDKQFSSLRRALVASLVRFVTEALPDTGSDSESIPS
jgi:AcrR family transcriptional regulator